MDGIKDIMKLAALIHPFLFALFPVIFLFSHNIRELPVSVIFAPAMLAILFTLVLLVLINLLIKNYQKTSIVLSSFMLFFFSYESFFFIPFGILFLASIYFVIRNKNELRVLTNVMNVVAFCLILLSLANIIFYEISDRSAKSKKEKTNLITNGNAPSHKNDKQPDIYYIILDRYAGSTTLKNEYKFDNRDFIQNLEKAGFYVASASTANYTKTAHSLASSLNMEYLNYLSQKLGPYSDNWTPLFEMIQNSNVQRFLKSRGYKSIYFGNTWLPTAHNQYADMNMHYNIGDNFSYKLFQKTLLYPVCSWLDIRYFKDSRKLQWETVQWQFNTIAEMPGIKGPKFVFAHLLIPHEPYVFDRNGKFIENELSVSQDSDPNTIKIEYHRKYIDQLVYTNKKVMELVNRLLTRSELPPIIIIQADEGPFPVRYLIKFVNNQDFNWKREATDEEIKEKYYVLNALYLPGLDKRSLHPHLTPVNTFRIVFNHYFKTNLEILPDEQYAHEDDHHPYRLFSITEKFR